MGTKKKAMLRIPYVDRDNEVIPYPPLSYNLILEGVHPTLITEESDLLNHFQIDVGDISDFTIEGSDIKANIDTYTLSLLAGAFNDEGALHSFYFDGDVDILSDNAFESSGLAKYECTGTTRVGRRYVFLECQNLSFENITSSLWYLVDSTDIEGVFGQISNNGSTLNFTTEPIINLIGAFNMFRGSTDTVKMIYTEELDIVPPTYSFHRYMFGEFNGTVQLWRCISLMPTGSLNGSLTTRVFGVHDTTMTIEINVINKTINSGSPHADLVDAENRGATIIYTDNNGVPQP